MATTNDLAMLNTLAQVAGGAFATLVTVVVFAIGLIAQRADGASTYMPFVARRYHVFVAAALAAAVSLLNAVGPIVGEHTGMIAVKYLLLANVALMPAVFLATLWLMCRVIEAASGADLVATLPVFRSAMRRIAEYDQRQASIANQFFALLNDPPIEFNRWAGYSALDKGKGSRLFGNGVPNLIVDVDLHVLRQIQALCHSLRDWAEFSVLAAPTFEGDTRGVLCVSLIPTKQVPRETGNVTSSGKQSAIAGRESATLDTIFGPDRLARLSALADRLFIYGNRPDTDADLRQFFARTQIDLERLALAGESVLFEARLEDYRALLGEWLAVAGPSTSPLQPRFMAYREPRFVGPLEIDLADILRAAVQSDDFETYRAAVDGVSAVVSDADSHKAVTLFADAARLLSFAFYLSMQKPELRLPARELFDRRVESLLTVRQSLRNSYEEPDETGDNVHDSGEGSMRYAIIGSLLSMIRYAIEAGESKTAEMMIDRLTRRIEAEHRRTRVAESAPTRDNSDAIIHYAIIVVIGWCQHMIRENHVQHAAANDVMAYALKSIPPQHMLIGLWELYHGDSPRAEIDEALRVSMWDIGDSERRVGFVYTSSGGSSWITDGFWVAMLHSSSPQDYELRDYFRAPPHRWLWRAEGLEERLTQLQGSLLPAGATDELRATRSEVVKLVRQRQRVADAASLRDIAQTPLSAGRVSRLQQEIREGISEHRIWQLIVSEKSGLSRMATKSPEPARLRTLVHRDYLLDINNWGGDYGKMIAEDVVRIESINLIHLLELALPPGDIPVLLAELGNCVRRAVSALSNRGFKADLLILPPRDRFACALFRRPLWDPKIGKRTEWGDASVGEWEGLTVVRCPYTNTSSVIVADSGAIWGRVEQRPAQPTIELTDVSKEIMESFLAKVTEIGSEPLPDSGDLRVATLVSLTPVVGLADINAAYRLDVTKGDGCFAMEPDDGLYHRAVCSEIEGAEHLLFSLSKR